ncbi:hypothetical protein EPN52_09690 [bacterium]|nr:MAG: hypothetical protein EPN52_09690 [bacterium]
MCHYTASLVARALESAGIPTVIVGTMRSSLVNVPRALVTPYADAPMGPPGAPIVHRAVAASALELLRAAQEPVKIEFESDDHAVTVESA